MIKASKFATLTAAAVLALTLAGCTSSGEPAAVETTAAAVSTPAPAMAVDATPVNAAEDARNSGASEELVQLYTEGAPVFDEQAATFALPLPDGYSWPDGASLDVTPESAKDRVWYVWIAANADAASRGNDAAAAALKAQDLPFSGGMLSDVRAHVRNGDYSTLLQMFPLPPGTRTS